MINVLSIQVPAGQRQSTVFTLEQTIQQQLMQPIAIAYQGTFLPCGCM